MKGKIEFVFGAWVSSPRVTGQIAWDRGQTWSGKTGGSLRAERPSRRTFLVSTRMGDIISGAGIFEMKGLPADCWVIQHGWYQVPFVVIVFPYTPDAKYKKYKMTVRFGVITQQPHSPFSGM